MADHPAEHELVRELAALRRQTHQPHNRRDPQQAKPGQIAKVKPLPLAPHEVKRQHGDGQDRHQDFWQYGDDARLGIS